MVARSVYLPIEPLLIFAPLFLHLSSSILKRAIISSRTRRLPRSSHLITGWALIPFVLPHMAFHRLIPSSPDPPISALSPSELDFDFVAWSMYRFPLWSTAGYLGLVGLGVWHAALGTMVVVGWLRPPKATVKKASPPPVTQPAKPKRRLGKAGAQWVLLGLMGVVAVGLARLYEQGKGIGGPIVRRYEAVHGMGL